MYTVYIDVSWNKSTPSSHPFIDGFSLINYKPSILGYPQFKKPLYIYSIDIDIHL